VITVKWKIAEFEKKMKNTTDYGFGFFEGVQLERLRVNRFLGGFVAEALGKYIDAQARSNPAALEHVYEPGGNGDEGSRLFKFNVNANMTNIHFEGNFLPSSGEPLNGGDPLVDRAEIMENQISITITPHEGGVLAFEDGGEMAFTRDEIIIDHPGGDAASEAFGTTVDEFFQSYLTLSLLGPMLNDLRTADQFSQGFASAATGGRAAGVRAGRKYLTDAEMVIE